MTPNKEMLLSMKEEKLQNQNYNMSALALANMTGYINKIENYRVFSKTQFIGLLKTRLKLSKHKSNVILDTFQELGCIEINGDECHLLPVIGNCFLKIDFRTAQFCLNSMTPLTFKIYCYLLNKYNINQNYNYVENYFFSKMELLRMSGYTDTGANKRMITDCLAALRKLELIEYNEESVYKKGYRGRYFELYKVNLHTPAQEQADRENEQEEKEEQKKFELKDDIKSLEACADKCIILDRKGKETYLSVSQIIDRLRLPTHMLSYKTMIESMEWAVQQKKNQDFFDNHEDEVYKYMP